MVPYTPLYLFSTCCSHHSLSCHFHYFLPSRLPSLMTECDSENVDSEPEGPGCRWGPFGNNHRSQDQYQRTVSWTGHCLGWQRLTDERTHCYTGQEQRLRQSPRSFSMHRCTNTEMHKYTHTETWCHQSLWNRYMQMCLPHVRMDAFSYTTCTIHDVT